MEDPLRFQTPQSNLERLTAFEKTFGLVFDKLDDKIDRALKLLRP